MIEPLASEETTAPVDTPFTGRRSFVRDNAAALSLQAGTLIVSLGSFYVIARQLRSESYGLYVGLYALIFPISGIAYQGALRLLIQLRSQAGLAEPEALRRTLTIAAPVLAACCLITSGVALAIFGVSNLGAACIIIVNELLLGAVIEGVGALKICRTGFASAVHLRLVPIVGRAVTVGIVIAADIRTILPIVLLTLVCNATLLTAVLLVRPLSGLRLAPAQGHGREDGKVMLLLGVDLFAVGAQTDADKVVLAAGSHRADSGVYAAAYKVVQLGLTPVNALLDATHVRLIESAKRGSKETLRMALRLSGLAVGYAAIAAPIMWLGMPVISDVMGNDFEGATQIGRWLLPVLVIRAPAILPLNALLAYGKVGVRAAISGSAALVGLIFYLVLIPAHSWRGAVAGTLASEMFLMIAAWVMLVRCSKQADRLAS